VQGPDTDVVKKNNRKQLLDAGDKPHTHENDPSWEKVFLSEDPDLQLETEARAFQAWMDHELSSIRSYAVADRDRQPMSRSQVKTPRKKNAPGRGVWESAHTLDLHGLTRDRALQACSIFLSELRQDGVMWAKLIVGKGHHSEGGQAVLRDAVEAHLQVMKKNAALIDWFWEQKEKSKSGALLVQLRC
jgi:DNA-nicking Smr family endonuclease